MENKIASIISQELNLTLSEENWKGLDYQVVNYLDINKKLFFEPQTHTLYEYENRDDLESIISGCINQEKAYISDPYSYNKISSIEFYITEACNLSCSYCYLGPLPSKVKINDIHPTKAIETIEHLFLNNKISSSLKFAFIGGEPLMAFNGINQIVKAVNYLSNEHGIKVTYEITTNGLLLIKNNISSFLLKNNFFITLSHDGLFNISNRPKKNTSYSIDLKVISSLYSSDNLTINTTLNLPQLLFQKEVFEYFTSLGISNVYISSSYGNIYNDINISDNIKGIEDLFNSNIKTGVYEGHMNSTFQSILSRNLSSSHCSAGLSHIVLNSDGKIKGCANLRSDQYQQKLSKTYNVDSDKTCKSCSLRYICTGGCRAWRIIRDNENPDPMECATKAARILLAFKRLLLKKSNG